MASQRSTGKDTSSQNQPPSCETKRSLSNKPLAFPTYDPYGRYTPNSNLKSSSNIELRGVTPEESVFLIPNNKVNQLH